MRNYIKYLAQFFLFFLICGCCNNADNKLEKSGEHNEAISEQLSYEGADFGEDSIAEDDNIMSEMEDVSQVVHEQKEFEIMGDFLLEMKDGLQNELINQLYVKEFNELSELSSSSKIVNVYEYDLNHDGINDKIVFLRSAIHSSTGGDTLHIWMSNGEMFEKVLDEIFYLMDMNNQFVAEAYVCDNYSNTCSIKVVTDEKICFLLFDGMKYIRSEYAN